MSVAFSADCPYYLYESFQKYSHQQFVLDADNFPDTSPTIDVFYRATINTQDLNSDHTFPDECDAAHGEILIDITYDNHEAVTGFVADTNVYMVYFQWVTDPDLEIPEYESVIVDTELSTAKDKDLLVEEWIGDNRFRFNDEEATVDWTLNDNWYDQFSYGSNEYWELRNHYEEYSDEGVLTYQYTSIKRPLGTADTRDPHFNLDVDYTTYFGAMLFKDEASPTI